MITVGARPAVAPLFSLVPGVAGVVRLDAEDERALKDRGFDTALLLPNSFHAALMASRAGIRERWGYRTQWRGRLLTRATRVQGRASTRWSTTSGSCARSDSRTVPAAPRLDVPADTRTAGAGALERAGWDGATPLVAIAPGAAYGGAKRWPAASFAELARHVGGGRRDDRDGRRPGRRRHGPRDRSVHRRPPRRRL